jgi:coenzyme PQQ precursor peptide PqqA
LTPRGPTNIVCSELRRLAGGYVMAWKTPKIIEIALGAEINSYACADLT